MDFSEFNSLFELLKVYSNEDICIKEYEKLKWGASPICAFCSNTKIYKIKRNHYYKCSKCRKCFTVKHGTIFQSSNIGLQKWFIAIYLMASHKKGISSVQLSKDIGVTQKTAWFMLQKIRHLLFDHNLGKLHGVIEVDETFVGGKNKNRHNDKKFKYSQGRSFKDKVPVIGMLQRGGKLVARVIENTSGKCLIPQIKKHISRESIVLSDEWLGYKTLHTINEHYIIDHSKGYYKNELACTNAIEGFWSHFKRGIFGIYHKVSKKHLNKYVDEFVYRYNTRKLTEYQKFCYILKNSSRVLTYKQLIYELYG